MNTTLHKRITSLEFSHSEPVTWHSIIQLDEETKLEAMKREEIPLSEKKYCWFIEIVDPKCTLIKQEENNGI